MKEIKKLYYIKNERIQYFNAKHIQVASVPIIEENKQSYIVPWYECTYQGAEERIEKWGKDYYLKHCYRVNKKTLKAKISNYGITHRQYFNNLEDLKDYLFLELNKYKIIESIRFINDPKFFKKLVRNYEIKDLISVDEIIVE